MADLEELGYDKFLSRSVFFSQGGNGSFSGNPIFSQGQVNSAFGEGALSLSQTGIGTLVSGEDIQTQNFVSGSTGWKIQGNGDVEFNSGTFRASLVAGEIHIPDENTTPASFHTSSSGNTWWGATESVFNSNNSAAKAYILSSGIAKFQSVTLSNSVILTDLASGSDLAFQGWQFSGTYSSTDADTVAWTAGTLTFQNGVTYSITGSNTGNMSALTYIYFDRAVSTTAFQVTTTAATAIGQNKRLVAVAQNNSDATSKAQFQVFGGTGGQTLFVDNLAANSASTNEFVSNTAQIANLIVTNAKINDLAVSKLTAGTISSKIFTLAVAAGTGDVYFAGGTIDAAAWTATNGFILGLDDSDNDEVKFYIGNSTSSFDYNVTTADTVTIKGIFTVQAGSTLPTLPTDNNLILYLPFDEGTGTTAIDHSASVANGTIATATYQAGISGGCLTFNGASGSVTITDAAAIQNVWDGGGSISCWINPNSDGEGDGGTVASKGSGWTIRVQDELAGFVKLRLFQTFSGSSAAWTTTSALIPINSWTKIGVFYNSDSASNDPTLLINGASVAITEDVAPIGTRTSDVGSDLYIGNQSSDARTFDGEIDEVRLYGSVLTALEDYALYQNPSGVSLTGVKQLGGNYASATSGARMIFDNTQLLLNDNGGTQVFKATLSGANIGDVDIGNYGSTGGGVRWDKSATKLLVDGTIEAAGTIVNTGADDIEYRANSFFNEIIFTGDKDDGATQAVDGNGAITRNPLDSEIKFGTTSTNGTAAMIRFASIGTVSSGFAGNWDTDHEFIVAAKFSATTTQDAFMGLDGFAGTIPANSTSTTRHVGFMIQDGTLYGSVADATTQTKSSAIAGVTLTDWNVYRIVFTSATSALFYTKTLAANDYTLQATLTTNLPSGTGTSVGMTMGVTSDAAAERILYIRNKYLLISTP